MRQTAEIATRIFSRGARVICEGSGEGPYARFEGRVAASHEGVLHLNLLGGRNPDHLVSVGETVNLHVVATHGWFAAQGQRINNVVPGGVTLRLIGSPNRVERREYLRVRCNVPVEWRLVKREDVEARAAEIEASQRRLGTGEGTVPSMPGIADPDIAKILGELLARVRALEEKVERLTTESTEAVGTNDFVIDISGSGMRVLTDAALQVEDTIEATLHFDEPDSRDVTLMAVVTRIDPPNFGRSHPTAACQFRMIGSKDREWIIRYTFRAHRRQLRDSLV